MLTWGTLPPSPTPTPSPGKVTPPHSAPKWDPRKGPYALHLSPIGGPLRGPAFCVARLAGLSFGGRAGGVGIAGEIGVVGGTIPLSPSLVPPYLAPFTRTHVYIRRMPRKLPGRVKRKRARLFTQAECAKALGISRSTLQRIEARPLPDDLVRYLDLVGYQVGFYPVRKGQG